jgi:uncharacterized protein YsxB (DUF464 family)
MIQVLLQRSSDGQLVACNAQGHAGYDKKGFDIVCSAVTILLRTTVQVLQSDEHANLEVQTPSPGNLAFQVKEACKALLIYAEDFLETGLKSLEAEFPKHVSLRVEIVD